MTVGELADRIEETLRLLGHSDVKWLTNAILTRHKLHRRRGSSSLDGEPWGQRDFTAWVMSEAAAAIRRYERKRGKKEQGHADSA